MDSFLCEVQCEEVYVPTAQDWAEYTAWLAAQDANDDGEWLDEYADDNDGQPDEYTEWQDYMGGDDWDHGEYEFDRDFGWEG